MVLVVGVWIFSIGVLLVSTEAVEECLVYDVGGKGGPPRSPTITLQHDVVIGIFTGHQRPHTSRYVDSPEGSSEGHDHGRSSEAVELEVQLEAGGKTFVLRFRDHKLHLLQEATPAVDMGVASFPLYEAGGKWQYVGVAVGGGWLTVSSPSQEEAVFQTPIGVDTSHCRLSVASFSSRLALTFNCIAGCPVVRTSGSVVTTGLPLVKRSSLYLQPDDPRYTAMLAVDLVLEEQKKETLLLEVRPGLLRLHEWNRVDLTLEPRQDEVEALLEVNGEAGASDVVPGRLVSAALGLEELTHGALSTRCRPTRSHDLRQASSGTTEPAGSCSWNLVWALVGVSSLLFILLLGTCCSLYGRRSGQVGATQPSTGLAMNSLRHPRSGDKTLSYHHYEEVEAVMETVRRSTKNQEDRGRPMKPLEAQGPAIPLENLNEEPLDLGTGEGLLAGRVYENLLLNTRT